jgi:hypothetical protein
MRKSIAWLSALVAIGFFLVASYVVAQVPSSDRIQILANDRTTTEFPSPNFHPLDQFIAEDGEAGGTCFGTIHCTFSSLIGVRSGVHNATFNTAVTLTEPGGGASDFIVLSAVSTGGVQSWTLNFFSDPEGGFPPILVSLVGPPTLVPETGGVQDISGLFLDSDGQTRITPLFNVLVQSDVEPVPEPSTWLLFGSGLAGMMLWRRLRRKKLCPK